MKVKVLAAVGALVLGLAAANQVEAASCSCEAGRPHKVVPSRVRHAAAAQPEIVYGESRAHRAPAAPAAPVAPPEYAEEPPSEPFYADPAYSDPAVYGSLAYYTYGYGAPLARGARLAGYRPHGYHAYGYRPYGYARDGWHGGYAGRGGVGYGDGGSWSR